MNTNAQLEAVERRFAIQDRDGEPSHVTTLRQTYPVHVEESWDAVTNPERISRWFLPISGQLELNGQYQLEGNANGTVLECDPPADGTARYLVTWEFGGGMSWVEVRLTGQDRSTRFQLEHVARAADMPIQMWETYGPGATGVGWDGGLLGLAQHLGASESSITPEQAAAWALSDEGREFYRGAADAWGNAHVASGADPDVARACADASYSGSSE